MPIDTGTLAAFAITALVIYLVPGPDMLFIVAMALWHGPRGGAVAAGGMAGGDGDPHGRRGYRALGLLASSATAFSVLRLLGVAYLCWLAIEALRRSGPDDLKDGAGAVPASDQSRILFRRASAHQSSPIQIVVHSASN